MSDVAGDYTPMYELTQRPDAETQRAAKHLQWFRQSYERTQVFRELAIESYNFVSGQQWSEADIARLREQRRPIVTINMCLAPILFLSGMQRQNRTAPKLVPFEPGDVKSTEFMNSLLHWYGDQCQEMGVDSQVFLDKIITGLGFWKIRIDYTESLEGDPIWERVSPLSIYVDPNWPDCLWKDIDYVQHAVWMKLDDAIAQWPEHEDEIRRRFGEWVGNDSGTGRSSNLGATGRHAGDSQADRRMFWDAGTQRVRILETWYVTRKQVPVAIDKETQEVTADPEKVKMAHWVAKQDRAAKERLLFLKRPVRLVRQSHILLDVELDDVASPHDSPHVPIFPALGHYFWERPFGAVEPMKDLQREKNKRRATLLELVTRMAHSGWLNDETQGARRDELEEFATGNGVVINHQGVAPQQLKPPELPQTLVYLDNATNKEIHSVINVNQEMLGSSTPRTVSGRALEARQKSGAVVQEPMIDTFEGEKALATKFFVGVIQQYTPISKALRILGSQAARQPMAPMAQMMQETDPVAILQALRDAFEMRFDAVIRHEPWDPSQNRLQWQTLAELAKDFGPYIPPQLLVESAKNAGIITEEQAQQVLLYVQQQEEMRQATVASTAQSGAVPPANAVTRGA